MDERLRQLERKALTTQEESDIRAFLVAAYRAGLFRIPTREQIQRILREQVKEDTRRGRKLEARSLHSLHGGRNASGLQHPKDVRLWDGDHESWRSALRRALPGEVFEIDIYYRVRNVHSHDWSLDTTIAVSVPSKIYIFDGSAYGPPVQDNPYCRCDN